MEHNNNAFTRLFDAEPLNAEQILSEYSGYAEQLKPYVRNVEQSIYQAIQGGENVLFEGAQGTFLDLTSGTYPYVTSSNTVAAGICVGAGIGPRHIDHVIGVIKAYTTRVGKGPLPSSVDEAEMFLDHNLDREIGTTTGRKRRIGWFDSVLIRDSARLNSFDSIALTKLDVLDKLPMIKICTKYWLDGEEVHHLPWLSEDIARVKPEYEELPGWQSPTSQVGSWEDLPENAKRYIRRIEELCGVPVSILSLGPERERTLTLQHLF